MKTIQEGGSKLDKYKSAIMKYLAQKGSANNNTTAAEKFQQISNMRTARYFNVFYAMFKYYGVNIYKVDVLPVIKEYVDKGFKEIEHPSVCKALLVDIVAAFLRTCKYYYEDNEQLYIESLELIFNMLEENEQIDQTEYIKNSLEEAFRDRDPLRFEKLLNTYSSDIPLNQTTKARNLLCFNHYLSFAFSWRHLEYQRKTVEAILKYDNSLITPPKNLADHIKPSQSLIMNKNWPFVVKIFSTYITRVHRYAQKLDDELMKNILTYLDKAIEELEQDTDDLLLNGCLSNVIEVYKNVCQDKNLISLSTDFIIHGLKISFACIQKSANKQTLDASLGLVKDVVSSINVSKDFSQVKDYLLSFKNDENWRIREHVLFILEGLNSLAIRYQKLDFLDETSILPFLEDDNLYVVKMARMCLKTILTVKPDNLEKLAEEYQKKANETLKRSKESKSCSKELVTQIQVLLGCCYACNYSIPTYLPKLCLFLHSWVPVAAECRTDIYELISRFKSIHQPVVKYQPQRFTEEELDTLKELFSISSSQSMNF